MKYPFVVVAVLATFLTVFGIPQPASAATSTVGLCNTSYYPNTWWSGVKTDIQANQGFTDWENVNIKVIIFRQDNYSDTRVMVVKPDLQVELVESTTGNRTNFKLTNNTGANQQAYTIGFDTNFTINRRSAFTISPNSNQTLDFTPTTQCISAVTDNVTYNANVSQVFPNSFPYFDGIAPIINFDACPYNSAINTANSLCVAPPDPVIGAITPEEFAQYTGIIISIIIGGSIIWSFRFKTI